MPSNSTKFRLLITLVGVVLVSVSWHLGYVHFQWRTEGGLGGSNPLEISKALQNRAKVNPIVKTVKNC